MKPVLALLAVAAAVLGLLALTCGPITADCTLPTGSSFDCQITAEVAPPPPVCTGPTCPCCQRYERGEPRLRHGRGQCSAFSVQCSAGQGRAREGPQSHPGIDRPAAAGGRLRKAARRS